MQGFAKILVLVMVCLSSIQLVSADQLLEYRYFKIEYKPYASDKGYSVQMFADGTVFYEGKDGNIEVGFRVVHKPSNVFQKVSDLLGSEPFQSYRKLPCAVEENNSMAHRAHFLLKTAHRKHAIAAPKDGGPKLLLVCRAARRLRKVNFMPCSRRLESL